MIIAENLAHLPCTVVSQMRFQRPGLSFKGKNWKVWRGPPSSYNSNSAKHS